MRGLRCHDPLPLWQNWSCAANVYRHTWADMCATLLRPLTLYFIYGLVCYWFPNHAVLFEEQEGTGQAGLQCAWNMPTPRSAPQHTALG